MSIVASIVFWMLAGTGLVLLFLVTILLAEICAGCWLPDPDDTLATFPRAARIAVLIPAHNEADGIAEVIRNVTSELRPGDRVLVVADNCTDDTYDVAIACGAEVIRRTDFVLRGKGFALEFGMSHLAADPPDVVIMVDADCLASRGSLLRIAAYAAARHRPVQAHYAMLPPAPEASASASMLIAAFAWHVKNKVRPLGLRRLGLPCHLMGSGMAFPWTVIAQAKLGTAELVEDQVLGLELAQAGHAPLFCSEALVTSLFPVSIEGQTTQRARWETGHLAVILRRLPGLLLEALANRNVELLVLACDAAVPPLAFLAILIAINFVLAIILISFGGSAIPLLIGCLSAIIFALSISIVWSQTFRNELPLIKIKSIPAYALGKLGLYGRAAIGGQREWVRTKRD